VYTHKIPSSESKFCKNTHHIRLPYYDHRVNSIVSRSSIMTGEISIEIMLDSQDHPNNSLEQELNKDSPLNSPTATLSCISNHDSQEEDNKSFKRDDDGWVGKRRDSASRPTMLMPSSKTTTNRMISETTVPPTNTASTQDFDQPTMNRMRQDFDNWKRERHELLKLRKLVRKQEQQQEELQAQLKAQKERGQVPYKHSQRDTYGTIAQSIVTDIGDKISHTSKKKQNSFPEDEISCQLEEMQSNLKASQQQVHDLQDQLLELRTDKERSKENQRRTQDTFEYQLNEVREQLDAERQDKGNIILGHEERLKAQQMKAEEQQNELNFKIQFWKQQHEKSQQQLQEQPATDPKGHPTKQGQETCKEDNRDKGPKGKVDNSSKQSNEQKEQLKSNPEEEKDTISKLQKELSGTKAKYEELKGRLANLEFVIQDMACNETLVQKILGVIKLLQKTKRENEKLKKEKLTLMTRSARR